MHVSTELKEGMSFTGVAPSGFEIPLSASASAGGAEDGFRPLELMALKAWRAAPGWMSFRSCAKNDRTSRPSKWMSMPNNLISTPYVFTHITVHYTITGKNVQTKAIDRAIELSSTKYCPAQAMLEKSVEIEHKYTLVDAK